MASLGPTSCFYWASKLPRGTFWARLKSLKSSTAAFQGFAPALPWYLPRPHKLFLCHGTPLGPTSCFYWASKLPRGTFWAPLKRLKSLKRSAAAFQGFAPALPWYLPSTWHVLGTPQYPKTLRSSFPRLRACFAMVPP